MSQRRSGKKATQTAELGGMVTSLAEEIGNAMNAIYNLQTALKNIARAGQDMLVRQFQETKDTFRSVWEEIIPCLEQAYSYSLDYISLCERAPGTSAPMAVAFYNDIGRVAKKNLEGVTALKLKHDASCKRFEKERSAYADAFRRGSWPQPKKSSNTSPNTANLQQQLMDISQQALYPNGPQVLKSTSMSLKRIARLLQDIGAFWKQEVEAHDAFVSRGDKARQPSAEELKKQAERWHRYQRAIMDAESSITESLDAMSVNAVGAMDGIRSTEASQNVIGPPEGSRPRLMSDPLASARGGDQPSNNFGGQHSSQRNPSQAVARKDKDLPLPPKSILGRIRLFVLGFFGPLRR